MSKGHGSQLSMQGKAPVTKTNAEGHYESPASLHNKWRASSTHAIPSIKAERRRGLSHVCSRLNTLGQAQEHSKGQAN